jgi:hypothetical protein
LGKLVGLSVLSMIDIPDDIKIKSTIREGSVFYFPEQAFKDPDRPHYYVVLNKEPISDKVLLMVCATTWDTGTFFWIDSRIKKGIPEKTFVTIETGRSHLFTRITFFDCNSISQRNITDLILKMKSNKLRMAGEIENDILQELKNGVKISPLVVEALKKLL